MATMSPEERQDYLARPHVGVLGVDDPGRGPLTVPIWYAYEPGGTVTILTHPQSRKAKLIQAAGRFSLCVQRERLPYKYVMVEGPVVETIECDIEEHARPMAHRYLGKELGDQYVEDGDDSTSIVIRMQPERWYSTDYGKTAD
ncbi:MAG: pyridoxamine 5'-phosphate oxidase family protein [Acidimicrobiales bacterium]